MQDPNDKKKSYYDLALEASEGMGDVERSAFMAQIRHETGDYKWNRELINKDGSFTPAQQGYGGGTAYTGRGLIQLTHKENYEAYETWAGLEPGTITNNPSVMSEDEEHQKAAARWFWDTRVKPNITDFSNTKKITRLINGGYNGLEERQRYFAEYNMPEIQGDWSAFLDPKKLLQVDATTPTKWYGYKQDENGVWRVDEVAQEPQLGSTGTRDISELTFEETMPAFFQGASFGYGSRGSDVEQKEIDPMEFNDRSRSILFMGNRDFEDFNKIPHEVRKMERTLRDGKGKLEGTIFGFTQKEEAASFLYDELGTMHPGSVEHFIDELVQGTLPQAHHDSIEYGTKAKVEAELSLAITAAAFVEARKAIGDDVTTPYYNLNERGLPTDPELLKFIEENTYDAYNDIAYGFTARNAVENDRIFAPGSDLDKLYDDVVYLNDVGTTHENLVGMTPEEYDALPWWSLSKSGHKVLSFGGAATRRTVAGLGINVQQRLRVEDGVAAFIGEGAVYAYPSMAIGWIGRAKGWSKAKNIVMSTLAGIATDRMVSRRGEGDLHNLIGHYWGDSAYVQTIGKHFAITAEDTAKEATDKEVQEGIYVAFGVEAVGAVLPPMFKGLLRGAKAAKRGAKAVKNINFRDMYSAEKMRDMFGKNADEVVDLVDDMDPLDPPDRLIEIIDEMDEPNIEITEMHGGFGIPSVKGIQDFWDSMVSNLEDIHKRRNPGGETPDNMFKFYGGLHPDMFKDAYNKFKDLTKALGELNPSDMLGRERILKQIDETVESMAGAEKAEAPKGADEGVEVRAETVEGISIPKTEEIPTARKTITESDIKKIDDCPEGECLRNAIRTADANKDLGARVIQGEIYMPRYGEKKMHSWVEIGDMVYDPTIDLLKPKSDFYKAFDATVTNDLASEEATLLAVRLNFSAPHRAYSVYTPDEIATVREILADAPEDIRYMHAGIPINDLIEELANLKGIKAIRDFAKKHGFTSKGSQTEALRGKVHEELVGEGRQQSLSPEHELITSSADAEAHVKAVEGKSNLKEDLENTTAKEEAEIADTKFFDDQEGLFETSADKTMLYKKVKAWLGNHLGSIRFARRIKEEGGNMAPEELENLKAHQRAMFLKAKGQRASIYQESEQTLDVMDMPLKGDGSIQRWLEGNGFDAKLPENERIAIEDKITERDRILKAQKESGEDKIAEKIKEGKELTDEEIASLEVAEVGRIKDELDATNKRVEELSSEVGDDDWFVIEEREKEMLTVEREQLEADQYASEQRLERIGELDKEIEVLHAALYEAKNIDENILRDAEKTIDKLEGKIASLESTADANVEVATRLIEQNKELNRAVKKLLKKWAKDSKLGSVSELNETINNLRKEVKAEKKRSKKDESKTVKRLERENKALKKKESELFKQLSESSKQRRKARTAEATVEKNEKKIEKLEREATVLESASLLRHQRDVLKQVRKFRKWLDNVPSDIADGILEAARTTRELTKTELKALKDGGITDIYNDLRSSGALELDDEGVYALLQQLEELDKELKALKKQKKAEAGIDVDAAEKKVKAKTKTIQELEDELTALRELSPEEAADAAKLVEDLESGLAIAKQELAELQKTFDETPIGKLRKARADYKAAWAEKTRTSQKIEDVKDVELTVDEAAEAAEVNAKIDRLREQNSLLRKEWKQTDQGRLETSGRKAKQLEKKAAKLREEIEEGAEVDVIDELENARARVKALEQDLALLEGDAAATVNVAINRISRDLDEVERLQEFIDSKTGKVDPMREALGELQEAYEQHRNRPSDLQREYNLVRAWLKMQKLRAVGVDTNKARMMQTVQVPGSDDMAKLESMMAQNERRNGMNGKELSNILRDFSSFGKGWGSAGTSKALMSWLDMHPIVGVVSPSRPRNFLTARSGGRTKATRGAAQSLYNYLKSSAITALVSGESTLKLALGTGTAAQVSRMLIREMLIKRGFAWAARGDFARVLEVEKKVRAMPSLPKRKRPERRGIIETIATPSRPSKNVVVPDDGETKTGWGVDVSEGKLKHLGKEIAGDDLTPGSWEVFMIENDGVRETLGVWQGITESISREGMAGLIDENLIKVGMDKVTLEYLISESVDRGMVSTPEAIYQRMVALIELDNGVVDGSIKIMDGRKWLGERLGVPQKEAEFLISIHDRAKNHQRRATLTNRVPQKLRWLQSLSRIPGVDIIALFMKTRANTATLAVEMIPGFGVAFRSWRGLNETPFDKTTSLEMQLFGLAVVAGGITLSNMVDDEIVEIDKYGKVWFYGQASAKDIEKEIRRVLSVDPTYFRRSIEGFNEYQDEVFGDAPAAASTYVDVKRYDPDNPEDVERYIQEQLMGESVMKDGIAMVRKEVSPIGHLGSAMVTGIITDRLVKGAPMDRRDETSTGKQILGAYYSSVMNVFGIGSVFDIFETLDRVAKDPTNVTAIAQVFIGNAISPLKQLMTSSQGVLSYMGESYEGRFNRKEHLGFVESLMSNVYWSENLDEGRGDWTGMPMTRAQRTHFGSTNMEVLLTPHEIVTHKFAITIEPQNPKTVLHFTGIDLYEFKHTNSGHSAYRTLNMSASNIQGKPKHYMKRRLNQQLHEYYKTAEFASALAVAEDYNSLRHQDPDNPVHRGRLIAFKRKGDKVRDKLTGIRSNYWDAASSEFFQSGDTDNYVNADGVTLTEQLAINAASKAAATTYEEEVKAKTDQEVLDQVGGK